MRTSGFTLLELVMVLVIIGILVSLGIPGFFKTVERSRMSEGTRMLGVVRMAQMRYYAEHATFTSNLNELDVDLANGKYFDFSTVSPGAGCTPGSSGCYVAAVQRNLNQNMYGSQYILRITPSGNICADSSSWPNDLGSLVPTC